MSTESPEIRLGQKVVHPNLGEGVVVAPPQGGFANVFFRSHGERRVPVDALAEQRDPLERLVSFLRPAKADDIERLDLAVEAVALPLMENAAALTSAKIDLLPHQIVLVHRVANAGCRRFLIADEVGLGKTIETALILRELASRGELSRAIMIVPAGLVENWRHELNDVFHLDFEVFGSEGDVSDRHSNAFQLHNRLIASIDTLKQKNRVSKILDAPPWDLVVFDEAHHLTATKSGRKVKKTLNFNLADAIRDHCRDLLLLSATPHQGDHFRFWMLIRLLSPNLFYDENDMTENRYRLNSVVVRRTKADACTADGGNLFARRQVTTEIFDLSEEEKEFYKELNLYLIDGYNLAKQKGRQGQALGLVMTIFQKIAASSFAAIRITLEKRRLMLTVHEIIELDELRRTHERNEAIAYAINNIRTMYGLEDDALGNAQAESILNKLKLEILRRKKEEGTLISRTSEYADEMDERQAASIEDSVVSLAANALPQERDRISELLDKFPQSVESKTTVLIHALNQIWAESPNEKIVIFATYIGTVDAICKQLTRYFPDKGIDVLKGGDHGAKTAAQKRFRSPNGPQVLICTAAGREGINLQFARVLFNYDLPWNPMELEQRIGRIHRYGQNFTAQIYNLVAGNTIEGSIYLLLEKKLKAIATTLGKVDDQGEIAEDLRGLVLGQLGSQLKYDRLYKEAISDPTLERTSQELDVALRNADTARRVVFELFQDLDGFNLSDYEECEAGSDDNMKRLIRFTEAQAPLSGFTFTHDQHGFVVLTDRNGTSYTFTDDRDKALADDNLQLFGLEHPVITQLLTDASSLPPEQSALVCQAESPQEKGILITWVVNVKSQDGKTANHIIKTGVSLSGERNIALERTSKFVPWNSTATPETESLLSILPQAHAILVRELEYKSLVSEDASYSVNPMTLIYNA